jgi:tetratricopeptide (TPR) repeat protein
MDYEATLNQALDLLADSEERKAGRILQSCIDDIKKRITGDGDDLIRYYYWGRCLTAMEEVEQALLKFEKALRIDPDHEGSLWETASIFLHDLERPENARPILVDRLLKMHPDNALYQETLRAIDFSLKLRKAPPPLSKEEADSVGDELGGEGMSDDPSGAPGEDAPA